MKIKFILIISAALFALSAQASQCPADQLGCVDMEALKTTMDTAKANLDICLSKAAIQQKIDQAETAIKNGSYNIKYSITNKGVSYNGGYIPLGVENPANYWYGSSYKFYIIANGQKYYASCQSSNQGSCASGYVMAPADLGPQTVKYPLSSAGMAYKTGYIALTPQVAVPGWANGYNGASINKYYITANGTKYYSDCQSYYSNYCNGYITAPSDLGPQMLSYDIVNGSIEYGGGTLALSKKVISSYWINQTVVYSVSVNGTNYSSPSCSSNCKITAPADLGIQTITYPITGGTISYNGGTLALSASTKPWGVYTTYSLTTNGTTYSAQCSWGACSFSAPSDLKLDQADYLADLRSKLAAIQTGAINCATAQGDYDTASANYSKGFSCYGPWVGAGQRTYGSGDDATCYYDLYYNQAPHSPTLRFNGIAYSGDGICVINLEARYGALCQPLQPQMDLTVSSSGGSTTCYGQWTPGPTQTFDSSDDATCYNDIFKNRAPTSPTMRFASVVSSGNGKCMIATEVRSTVPCNSPLTTQIKIPGNSNFTVSWNLVNADSNYQTTCTVTANLPSQGGGYRVQSVGSSGGGQPALPTGPTTSGSKVFSNVPGGLYKFDFTCSGVLDNTLSTEKGTITKSVEVVVGGAPSNPQNVSVEATEDRHGFNVKWNPPAETGGLPISYEIDRTYLSSTTQLMLGTASDFAVGSGFSFPDNRIKDPSPAYSYKVIAANSYGQSSGVIASGVDVARPVTIAAIHGSGFTEDAKVYLVREGYTNIQCVSTRVSSTEIIDVSCPEAATGDWNVRVVANGQIADYPYTITYPEPVDPQIGISKTDLNDGIFQIDWVKGDNIYSGAIVKVGVAGSPNLTRQCGQPLSTFNYDTNEFTGVSCDVSSLLSAAHGSLSNLVITIANDVNSVNVEPTMKSGDGTEDISPSSFTCEDTNYQPAADAVCAGVSFTQNNVCGDSRSAVGTKAWTPDVSLSCTPSITQSCSDPLVSYSRTRVRNGTLSCTSGQICYNSACCTPQSAWECGIDSCGVNHGSCGCKHFNSRGDCDAWYSCDTTVGKCK